MSLPYSAPLFADGNFTVANPQGLPEGSSPIPATTAEYLLTQTYLIYRNNYVPMAQGTVHPDYPGFYLVQESPRTDTGVGGVVKFTRTFAAVPASYSDYETFAYNFIGTLGTQGINAPTIQGRGRTTWTVASRVQNDFFLVPSTVTDPILGKQVIINKPGDIPKIWAMQYVYQTTYNGVLYGGIYYPTDVLNPNGSTSPTYPTLDNYQSMLSDALTNGFNATVTIQTIFPTQTTAHYAGTIDTANSTLGGQIPAEDSRLTRWQGPIWLRQTRFVLAH